MAHGHGDGPTLPLHRHLIAAAGYLAVGWLLLANNDHGTYKEARDLAFAWMPQWLLTSIAMPTSVAGWVTVVVVALGGVHQLARTRQRYVQGFATSLADTNFTQALDGRYKYPLPKP
jgi:hypothetical protein